MPGGPGAAPNRLGPTRISALVAAALIGGAGAGALATAAEFATGAPLGLSWAGPLVLLAIAAGVAAVAVAAWRRINADRPSIEPERAVAWLALGKAAALGGALLAGGYLVFGLLSVGDIAAPAPRDRVLRSGVAALAAVGIAVAGLALERACRVNVEDDEDEVDK